MNEVSSNSSAVPQPANRQEIFLVSGAFAVGVVTLGAWEAALFKKISLSERSEFEIFLNAFSSFPNALELHGSETKPEIPSHSFASLLKKLMGKNKK